MRPEWKICIKELGSKDQTDHRLYESRNPITSWAAAQGLKGVPEEIASQAG